MTEEKLGALEKYAESPLFDDVEKLVLRYAEEYLSRGGASSEVVEALRKHYSDEQLVELDIALGIVNLVNHFIESFEIEIEASHVTAEERARLKKRMGR